MDWRLAMVVGLGACDRVLGLTEVAGTRDGAQPPVCEPNAAVLSDRFDQTSPCFPWGAQFANGGAQLAEGGGQLTIHGAAGAPSIAGCNASGAIAFDERGVFVAIDDFLRAPNAYTLLTVELVPDIAAVQLEIRPNGSLSLESYGGTTVYGVPLAYDPAQMRFLRLRRDPVSGDAVGEYSADAASWRVAATTAGAVQVPDQVYLVLSAGDDSEGDPSTAVFSHLNVCP